MLPSLNSSAEPLATYIMPRVQIKGATPKRVMTAPLTKPTSTPKSATQRITSGTLKKITLPFHKGRPLVNSAPATMPQMPATAPTERSIPPVRITSVMPMASRPVMATCWVIISRLDVVRKFGTITLKNAITSSRAMNVLAFSRYI